MVSGAESKSGWMGWVTGVHSEKCNREVHGGLHHHVLTDGFSKEKEKLTHVTEEGEKG